MIGERKVLYESMLFKSLNDMGLNWEGGSLDQDSMRFWQIKDDVFEIEPDGGIGDGAGPLPGDNDPVMGIPENNITGGGEGTRGNDFFYGTSDSDVFTFKDDHGHDMITGFDVRDDRLDLSDTEFDFTGLDSLLSRTTEDVDASGNVHGVIIETGDGSSIYIANVSMNDLASAQIDY